MRIWKLAFAQIRLVRLRINPENLQNRYMRIFSRNPIGCNNERENEWMTREIEKEENLTTRCRVNSLSKIKKARWTGGGGQKDRNERALQRVRGHKTPPIFVNQEIR